MIRNNISEPLDPETLQYLISLVEEPPDLGTIQAWTGEQRMEAEHWAIREHLHASDNFVPRLPRTAFLGPERNP